MKIRKLLATDATEFKATRLEGLVEHPEAFGEDSLYGLLDPFWSSQWTYRIPITLDNATGTAELTEHQVLLEIDSSLTDFWSNVNDDGSDIRFIHYWSPNVFSPGRYAHELSGSLRHQQACHLSALHLI